jgi:hypothetical protein
MASAGEAVDSMGLSERHRHRVLDIRFRVGLLPLVAVRLGYEEGVGVVVAPLEGS